MTHDELRALAEQIHPYERRNSDGAGGIAWNEEGIKRMYSRPETTTLLGWLYPREFTREEFLALLDEIDALRDLLESARRERGVLAARSDRYREALEKIRAEGFKEPVSGRLASRALSETGEPT